MSPVSPRRASLFDPRALPCAALLLAACAAEPPPVAQAPLAPPPAATPEPEPVAEPEAEATPEPEAEPEKPKSSGRPPVVLTGSEQIASSFGSSPAAKLELGDEDIAVLRIPENALDRSINVLFKLDPKAKTHGPAVGKVYRLLPTLPPATEPVSVASAGPPFRLELPAGARKDANLAIGETVKDEKGREKVEWRVVAPTRIDDVTNVAFFDMSSLPDAVLHVTTKPPTAPKPEPQP